MSPPISWDWLYSSTANIILAPETTKSRSLQIANVNASSKKETLGIIAIIPGLIIILFDQMWEKGLFEIVLFVHVVCILSYVACNVLLQLQYASMFVAKGTVTLVLYKYTHNYNNFVESKLDIIV